MSNIPICCLGNGYKILTRRCNFYPNCTHSITYNPVAFTVLYIEIWINSVLWPVMRISNHDFWDLFYWYVYMYWQVKQPHLFFFFLTIHTERMVMIIMMTAMNTTPATATEVAKVTTVIPTGCEVVAVGCEVEIAAWLKNHEVGICRCLSFQMLFHWSDQLVH